MKEKKISKTYNKIKELYNNRKYRALIILGGYAIFFLVVIMMINLSKTEVSGTDFKELTTIEKFKEINNYEYTYKVEKTLNDEIVYCNIMGRRNINKEIFNIENDTNTYYIENGETYIVQDNNKEKMNDSICINLLVLQPSNISNFLQSSTLQTTTTNHQNNTILNTYSLPLKDFIKLYFYEEIDDEENFVSIITTEENNNIIKIEMDFTNIGIYEEYTIDFDKLEFNYQNIGKVEEIIINNNL